MAKPVVVMSGDGNITASLSGKSYSIGMDHPNYKKGRAYLTSGQELTVEELDRILDMSVVVSTESLGKLTIEDGEIKYQGQSVHNSLADRIVDLLNSGAASDETVNENLLQPMVLFLENLMQNPSHSSVNELYDFLQHTGLSLTDDGHFLAYKGVRDDYTDRHTGKISNQVGEKPEMPRNMVDDNRSVGCSKGFHAGTFNYAKDYGPKVMLVKINPKDCVSVPLEHDQQKLRMCKYEVLEEYHNTEELDVPCYPVPKNDKPIDDYLDDEEDWFDDEYDDDEDYDDGPFTSW